MELQESTDNSEQKLSKLGFRLNLLGFTYFISVTGIIISTIGIIGGLTTLILPSAMGFRINFSFNTCRGLGCLGLAISSTHYGIGAFSLATTIGWLVMNCLLLKRCKQKNVPEIEKIAKIVNYIIGVVEILALIIAIVINAILIHSVAEILISSIVFLAIDMIFVSLKIHGIRKYNNVLVKTYIIYRYIIYILFALAAFAIFIWTASTFRGLWQWWLLGFVAAVVFFIMVMQEIGLTIVLHSIRLNNEKRSTSFYLNST